MPRLIALPMLAILASCATAPPPGPGFEPVADIHTVMEMVVYPNADKFWKSVGTIITEEGTEEIRPETDEEWEAILGNAYTLAEVGNLLLMKEREREDHVWASDDEDWTRYVHDFIAAGETAIEAVKSKNPEAVFDAGGVVYVACRNCHGKYLHEPGSPGAEMVF